MVESNALKLYPEIRASVWDRGVSCGCINLEDLKSSPSNQSRIFADMVICVSTDYFSKRHINIGRRVDGRMGENYKE